MAKKRKRPEILSRAYNQQPELDALQKLIWKAFVLLHDSRQMGYDRPQRVPVSECIKLAETIGLDPFHFSAVVVYLDSLYLKWYAENKMDKDSDGKH